MNKSSHRFWFSELGFDSRTFRHLWVDLFASGHCPDTCLYTCFTSHFTNCENRSIVIHTSPYIQYFWFNWQYFVELSSHELVFFKICFVSVVYFYWPRLMYKINKRLKRVAEYFHTHMHLCNTHVHNLWRLRWSTTFELQLYNCSTMGRAAWWIRTHRITWVLLSV